MVSSCSAFGCAYRHKKGDNIGLYRFPAKDEKLCRRWVMAVRRVNWTPSPTSRICGKHFLTGKPSKDENHPDYVPSVFVFNQNQSRKEHWQKVAEEKASQRVEEILHGAHKVDMTGYRRLKPKLAGYDIPFVIKARKADKQEPVNPAKQCFHFSSMMKENTQNRKEVEASNNNGMFLFQKEIRPSVPQRVWVLNFDSGKDDSNVSVEKPKELKKETAPVTSLKKNFPASVSNSSIMIYEGSEPLCVESSMTISDDDSTLTAESSIPDTEDIETFMATSENATSLNVDAIENVSNNASLDNISSPVVNSATEDTTDSYYSEFKSTPFDTKEILAIKLETMLAVNISLKQKVKVYQNRCKQYETEISHLTDTIRKLKLKHSIPHKN